MKHSVSLGVIFAIIVALSLVSLFFVASTQAGQVNLLDPKIDVQATAQAIQLHNRRAEIETAAQERLLTLQAKITQTRQTLDELARTTQTQAAHLEFQLANLRAQIKQTRAGIQSSQQKILQLQQDIRQDETDYQTGLAKLVTAVEQAQQELATAKLRLQAATNELAGRRLQTPALSVGNDENNQTSALEDNYNDSPGDNHDDDHNDHDDD